MKQLGRSCTVDVSVTCMTPSENSLEAYFILLDIHPPYDPATPLLDIYTVKMETRLHKKLV